ncbi:helix-turn-helix transcriptional regulator [Aliiroseovarius lamellibrachiae]|uniref:helix-turn-helix transcriptional regulator n=1 Tax=Aliiroseovarius lamellibrachiae TaxID=1924933 RepID=UPI001BDF8ACD|nr:AlpA family phage regulatory protein [Aliiroseovarius lamellibrachiae]MBT2132499.1 AlpA family phage regulatory protein [Aliiroseovarius lamellibrachiae]
MIDAPRNAHNDRLLTREDVISMVGFQIGAIYKKMAAGEFPKPVKIGRASRWSEHAIADWIEARKADSHAAV